MLDMGMLPVLVRARLVALLPSWPCWAAMPIVVGLTMLAEHTVFWESPDTPSFRTASAAADTLGQMRLPFYGWLLSGGDAVGLNAFAYTAMQVGCFGSGMAALMAALRRAGVGPAGVFGTGTALAVSDLVLLWGNCALPEMLAHAALLAAMAAALQMGSATRGGGGMAVLATGACSIAWLLKPAFLLFPISLPLLVLHRPGRRRWALLLLIILLTGPLALSALRTGRGDGFRPVSFGGFQMAGLAGLMLDDDLVARLPPSQQQSAHMVLDRRNQLVSTGLMSGIPRNSSGVRSFVSVAVFYFDILARDYDVLLWKGIRPLQSSDETWPDFDTRMQKLAMETVMAAPIRYAAWVIGASSRLVGQSLVLNPAMILA